MSPVRGAAAAIWLGRRAGGALALAAQTACLGGSASEVSGAPPPPGLPALEKSYRVSVELLGAEDCQAGGLLPETRDATATVRQDGVSVTWAQSVDDGNPWRLRGQVCGRRADGSQVQPELELGGEPGEDAPLIPGDVTATWVALRGALTIGTTGSGEGGRDVVAIGRDSIDIGVCEVWAIAPSLLPSSTVVCDDETAIRLHPDECGRLSGEVDAALRFERACARQAPCSLRLRWVAVPFGLDEVTCPAQ